VNDWGLVTARQILATLAPEVRQALCEHEGERELYRCQATYEVIGWRCLECDKVSRGRP
jgi:hypothetical protein